MQIHPPTGATSTPPASLAPTPAVLAGRRIGILDNRKPNAGLLLARLAERLAARTGAEVTLVQTKNAAIPCEDQVLGRPVEEVELVLTGAAD